MIFFFIPITCLLDSVGRNSVLVTYSLSCSLERYYEGRSRLLHKNTSQWPFHSGMNSTIFPRMLILRIWYWIKWSSCWWYLSWILITKFAWYCIDFGRKITFWSFLTTTLLGLLAFFTDRLNILLNPAPCI